MLRVLLCVCVQSSQCMWLMQALGFLLSALPEDEVLVSLLALITPHIQQLDSLVPQEVLQAKLMQPLQKTPLSTIVLKKY